MAENTVLRDFLKRNVLERIEASYQDAGFPRFTIKPYVDEKAIEEKREAMQQKHAENDAELARKAYEQIKISNEQKAKQTKNVKKQEELPPVEGPVMVGKKISEETEIRPMKTIVEEERIVVVQGYVFDSEVRELRSGRKILTFKKRCLMPSKSANGSKSKETSRKTAT